MRPCFVCVEVINIYLEHGEVKISKMHFFKNSKFWNDWTGLMRAMLNMNEADLYVCKHVRTKWNAFETAWTWMIAKYIKHYQNLICGVDSSIRNFSYKKGHVPNQNIFFSLASHCSTMILQDLNVSTSASDGKQELLILSCHFDVIVWKWLNLPIV